MNRFFNSFMIDLKVAIRNKFFLISFILAIVYSILILFVIPENIDTGFSNLYFVDNSSENIFSKMLDHPEIIFLENEEILKDIIIEKSNTIGIILNDNDYEIFVQGYESDKTINLIKSQINSIYNVLLNNENIHQNIPEIILLEKSQDQLSFNKNFIPMLLAMDVIFLGFMFVAVMVFQEKQEGGIFVYRVSPAGTFNYLMSKITVNTLIALMFALIFAFITIGFSINYFHYILIVFVSSFFVTAAGLFLGQFYDSVSNFIYTILSFTLILMLPMLVFVGIFEENVFFMILPSYPVFLGIKELLIEGRISNFSSIISILLIETIVIVSLTYYSLKKNLLKR